MSLSLRDAVRLLARAVVAPKTAGGPMTIEIPIGSELHGALMDALSGSLGAGVGGAAGQPEVDPVRAILAGCALFTIHGDSDQAVAAKAVARADQIMRELRGR